MCYRIRFFATAAIIIIFFQNLIRDVRRNQKELKLRKGVAPKLYVFFPESVEMFLQKEMRGDRDVKYFCANYSRFSRVRQFENRRGNLTLSF